MRREVRFRHADVLDWKMRDRDNCLKWEIIDRALEKLAKTEANPDWWDRGVGGVMADPNGDFVVVCTLEEE